MNFTGYRTYCRMLLNFKLHPNRHCTNILSKDGKQTFSRGKLNDMKKQINDKKTTITTTTKKIKMLY